MKMPAHAKSLDRVVVKVEWTATRTPAQRKDLANKTCDAVAKVTGLDRGQVTVVFPEEPLDLWSKGGVFGHEMAAAKPKAEAARKPAGRK
ncbi:MAG: tautomerase family protein [Proteobacteria bacterium]|nr:tautomerase family protein [Pseudomonadota bacterium]